MTSVAGAFLTAVNLLYAAMFGGPIDGTSWDVKVRQSGFFHWTSQSDTLIFHGGKAVIAGAIAKGYSPALYEAKESGGDTDFTVRLEGDGRAPVEWSGRVHAGRITGAIIVRALDGKVSRYVFSGGRKAG